ncbi:MAG: hypothetical protein ACJA0F_001209 [Dinoroseobacter sp.]|jgi:hypothetical protein
MNRITHTQKIGHSQLGKKTLQELKTFLIKTLPIYHKIVVAACQHGTDDQSD